MSLCPQCGSESAEENTPCAGCREAAGSGRRTEPPSESDRRFPFWLVLPWCLFGASLLLLLPHLRIHSLPLARPTPAPAAALPAAAPPSQPVAETTQVPLTVTLDSAADGRHVRVGTPVAISAYVSLPPGESASLAVSYDKDGSQKSLLALAQGSLSSTTWTPLAPGHYRFAASATNSGRISVFSRRLSIWVDALPAAPLTLPRPMQAAALPVPVRRRPARHRAARPAPAAVRPQPYHVAAATFPFPQNAAVLAGALRRRGIHAFVRTGVPGRASRAYTVETGDYLSPAEAQAQMRLLQRDGYPAYLFRLHEH